VRNLVRAGSSALLLLAMMFVGSLVLWIGLPLGCLYIGSRVQGATQSLGVALLAMVGALILGIATLVPLLGWMNRKHDELRAARGRQAYGQVTLEGVMVVSATLALLGFGIWFFFFSGSAPIPVLSGQ
jgi:hypothetical protein